MIFVAETEERSLYVFVSEAEAIANCEGLDVEAAVWLFWDDAGQPLEPRFSAPNKRGLFAVANGIYCLVSSTPNHHASLAESLEQVIHFEAPPPFNSKAGVRGYLASKSAAQNGA